MSLPTQKQWTIASVANMPVPGETPYGDEWMVRNGSRDHIPMRAWPLCRALCKGMGMGSDSDMFMTWIILCQNTLPMEMAAAEVARQMEIKEAK